MDDAKASILELLINGSLYGNESVVMYNNTLDTWKSKMTDLNIEYSLYINHSNISVSNKDGANILITANFQINISDRLSISRIEKDVIKTVVVSLENIEDPIFALGTGGYVSRSIRQYPYPYHAVKIGTGSAAVGDCIGNFTLDPGDPSPAQKILVTPDSTGVSGFMGVVSENSAVPATSCYILGMAGAVGLINQTFNASGYREIYLDEQTAAVWSLPINEAIDEGYYSGFSSSGPDIFKRLEGKLTSSPDSFETFVNIPQLVLSAVPIKPDQVSLAYLYFSSSNYPGVPVRGISINHDWFRVNDTIADRYNLTELIS